MSGEIVKHLRWSRPDHHEPPIVQWQLDLSRDLVVETVISLEQNVCSVLDPAFGFPNSNPKHNSS
jgi:hypothetical protein